MENLGRSREPSRKIVAPAVARLAGAASRPNAPGGGPLGKRVRERVVSGFQDARRRLVERDRGRRRRPVIRGRRRVCQSERPNTLRRRLEARSRRMASAADFLVFLRTGYPYGILFASPPKKFRGSVEREAGTLSQDLRVSRPGAAGWGRGGGAVKLMLQVPFRRAVDRGGTSQSRDRAGTQPQDFSLA